MIQAYTEKLNKVNESIEEATRFSKIDINYEKDVKDYIKLKLWLEEELKNLNV